MYVTTFVSAATSLSSTHKSGKQNCGFTYSHPCLPIPRAKLVLSAGHLGGARSLEKGTVIDINVGGDSWAGQIEQANNYGHKIGATCADTYFDYDYADRCV